MALSRAAYKFFFSLGRGWFCAEKRLDSRAARGYHICNFIDETDDVEITSVVPSPRVRAAESRAERRQANGSRRARGTVERPSISRRGGIRQLPGICWYPAKRTAYAVNQGGTADRKVFVLDRSLDSVRGFFAAQTLLRQDRGSVFCLSEVPYEVFTKPGNHQSLCGKRRI